MGLYHPDVLGNLPRKLLLMLLLLSLTGGQWAILQSAAWAGMLASRLRTESVQDAVVKTFDGRHACPLCKAVQTGRKSESKSEAVVKIPRVEFPPVDCNCDLYLDLNLRLANFATDEFAESLASLTPHRPPRSIA